MEWFVLLNGSIILLRLCDQAATMKTAGSSFCFTRVFQGPDE